MVIRFAKRYHPDLNPGCNVSASKFRAGVSAIQTIREIKLAHDEFGSSNFTSGYSRNAAHRRGPEFRYGAHFSTMPNSKHLRRNTSLSANQKFALGIGTVLLAGAAIAKLSTDSMHRDEAYTEWLGREEARKRERDSRPTHGKGRRRQTRNASNDSF